jgi:hypothetical protein
MKTTRFEIDPDDLYNYRVKRQARMMVFDAVQSGELVRPDVCEACDCKHENMQAHHTDYGQPLNVMWVCPTCHARIHADIGHPLNPVNYEQTLMQSIKTRITYAKVEFTLPVENYLIIKNRAEKKGMKVEEEISRSLIRAFPIRHDLRTDDDDAREQYFEGISSLVENEAELPEQELPRLSESRGEGGNFRSPMERFYSVSARYG